MASAKKAWWKFMRALENAPVGANFEVGVTWTKDRGWRPYQRVGDKVLMISSDQARGLHAIYERVGRDPQWRGTWESMKDTFDELKRSADDCDQKNRAGEVPQDAANYLPAEGRA